MTKIVNSMTAFQLNIKTLFGIENQLEHILPHLIDASTDEDLKNDFHMILKETKIHNERLEEIFDIIDMKPVKHLSFGIKGIVEDINNIIHDEPAGAIKDVFLAGAIRSFEYYEMANYMTAIQEAKNLGLHKAVSLLEETLEEEKNSEKEFGTVINHDLKLVADEETSD